MRYLIIILLFVTVNATAQSLNETIDYVNDILKVNHSWFGSTSGTGRAPNYSENPTYLIDRISVDGHGKIEFRIYSIDAITEKILKNGSTCYGYLKNLKVIKGGDFISNDVGKSIYRVSIYCPPSSKSCIICPDGNIDQKEFLINNDDARDRLVNAFSHLLEIAKDNKDYYTKDPFGK